MPILNERITSVVLLNDSFYPLIDGVVNTVANYQRIFMDKYNIYAPIVTPKQKNFNYKVYKYPIFPMRSIATEKFFGYRSGIPISPRIIKKIKRNPPQVIHVHSPFTALSFALILRNIVKCPIIFTYHTKFDVEMKKRVKNKFIYKLAHKYMVNQINSVDQIWAVNESVKEDLIANGCGDINTITMLNGTDMSGRHLPVELIKKYTSPYLYDDGRLVLLFVGRHFWVKGFKITLDALKKLKDNNVKFTFISIGDGYEEGEIKQYAKDLDLTDEDVKFLGAITDKDQLKAFYSVADLFLLPSTYDCCPIVVIEASANKTPSVLIRNSDSSSNKVDRENCFMIDENADSMYKLLTELDKDRELIKKVSENAFRNVFISWDKAVMKVLPKYHEAVRVYEKKKAKVRHNTLFNINIKIISAILNFLSFFVILKKDKKSK